MARSQQQQCQNQNQTTKVAIVDSENTWNMLISQAKLHGTPVAAHFTASWCIPSVAMKPHWEELALKHEDMLFLMVDVDDVKEVASKMNVKAMPTFLVMKEGTVVDKLIGANPEEIKKRVAAVGCTNQPSL